MPGLRLTATGTWTLDDVIATARQLDSAPLDPHAATPVSDADLRRIEPLQRVLLSPLDHTTVDGWRATVNRALVDALGGDAAMFQLDLPGLVPHYSEELQMDVLSEYREWMPDFERNKQVYRRSLRLGAGNRYTLWKPHLGWLYASEYYNGFIAELRAFDTLWAAAPVAGARYPAMIHTYHDRPDIGGRFEARDVQLMRLIKPALKAGVATVLRTVANRASLSASIDAQRNGSLVYGLDGELLHRSPAVAGITRTREAEQAVIRAGREMARALATDALVESLRPRNVSRTVSTRAGDFDLAAVRLGEGVFALTPVALVTLAAGSGPLPGRDEIRERFGLTRRQAEVALLLATRKTNREIGELLFISPHTARRHTEAVMAKLGVHDRREIGGALKAADRLVT